MNISLLIHVHFLHSTLFSRIRGDILRPLTSAGSGARAARSPIIFVELDPELQHGAALAPTATALILYSS
jgi:hypothetical protein